jgi:hypothetical protein
MNAEELLKIIKTNLDYNVIVDLTSPTMYDPDKLQNKVSFMVMEKLPEGCYKRFLVTVEDLRKIRYEDV